MQYESYSINPKYHVSARLDGSPFIDEKMVRLEGMGQTISSRVFLGCTWAHPCLLNARIEGCFFNDHRFVEGDLSFNTFKDCVFQNTVFDRCQLNQAVFEDCLFETTPFESTPPEGLTFRRCTFTGEIPPHLKKHATMEDCQVRENKEAPVVTTPAQAEPSPSGPAETTNEIPNPPPSPAKGRFSGIEMD